MLDFMIHDIRTTIEITDPIQMISDVIDRSSALKIEHEINTMRSQGVSLLIDMTRLSCIAFPNSGYPPYAMVGHNIGAAFFNSGFNPDKQLKNIVKALRKAREYYMAGKEMAFYGAIARAVVASATIAVCPYKNDKDGKIIKMRAEALCKEYIDGLFNQRAITNILSSSEELAALEYSTN